MKIERQHNTLVVDGDILSAEQVADLTGTMRERLDDIPVTDETRDERVSLCEDMCILCEAGIKLLTRPCDCDECAPSGVVQT